MSDTPISPGSGSVTIAGIAISMALVMVPLVGAWSTGGAASVLTPGTATVITPTVGSATLAGVASAITKPTVTGMTPTVGSMTFAGVASTLAQAIGSVTSADGGLSVWGGIANGQVGTFAPFRSGKVSLQVIGTFGSGGSIKLQGSNDLINWNDLSPATLTAAGFFAALGANEKPRAIRPNCTAGDATTSLTVTAWFSS